MPAHSYNIKKEKLSDLYLNQLLSTDAIAKIFDCNHVTVLNYLKKYNIPRRSKLGNRKPVNISKEILLDLYHNKRFNQKQIAAKFGHSRYGIQRWMRIYNIKTKTFEETHKVYPKSDFSGNLLEKAYLIGFRLGDLNVYKIRSLVQVRCSTTIQSQIDLIVSLFEKYGNVHVWKAKRGTLEVVVLLNNSFDFLLPKEDKIENWIISDKKLFLSFLAGYSDAEGSYYIRKPYYINAKSGWGVFEIQTYDRNIIEKIHQILLSLHIENMYTRSRLGGYIDKRNVITNKDCWRVTINKKQSLYNFVKLIKTFHKHLKKIEDLKRVEENLILRNDLAYCQRIIL